MISIVDVSSFQGPNIDWAKVSASGLADAAYVKLTEGASGAGSTDACGAQNLERGRAAGLKIGAYHFLSPLSAPDAQAQHFLQQLAAAGGCDLPVMLDVERGANGKLAPAAWVVTWLTIVEKALGKTPVLYTGAWVAALEHFASMPELARYPGWVAAYDARQAPPPCPPWGAWGAPDGPLVWQYTPKGMVAGVGVPCDLSRAWRMPGEAAAIGATTATTGTSSSGTMAAVIPSTERAPTTLRSSRGSDQPSSAEGEIGETDSGESSTPRIVG